ncbi:Aste57867_4882 [Aphanomyces stellatus]|uniref:Aste57867_4882 protein n=1 Tax=Aphanomyces stellatus TaxID=120398 RepID=A0A485KDK4_9STRA|nr:hypothetical protein As57867_004869 [Aphanomyces stellatus]VFT81974.1 Aste57867_4882 [Aphanomyces stellatus]
MCPGRGIVHSEMPASRDAPAVGLQLWLNLPARLKMTQPRYQEIPASGLPRVKQGNVEAIVIAGEAMGEKAAVFTNHPITYVHFLFSGPATHFHAIPSSHNAFVYVISGSGRIGDEAVEAHSVVLLTVFCLATEIEDMWSSGGGNGVYVEAGSKGIGTVMQHMEARTKTKRKASADDRNRDLLHPKQESYH